MATWVDVSGAEYPEEFNGNSIIPMAGTSLFPTFENKDLQSRDICWEHKGNKAIRLGEFKLVSQMKKGSQYNWELYDIEKDRSETQPD